MKKLIISVFVLILLLLGGLTAYKVLKTHNKHLMEVTEKRIIEAAKKCVIQKNVIIIPLH